MNKLSIKEINAIIQQRGGCLAKGSIVEMGDNYVFMSSNGIIVNKNVNCIRDNKYE